MSEDIQDDLYEQIDDYILGLLPASKINEIESLINTSDECNKYYLQQKKLIESSQIKDIPDPGESYWNEFPDSVLQNYKKTSGITEAQAKEDKASSGKKSYYASILQWWHTVSHPYAVVLPVLALVVIVSFTVILIDNNLLNSHQQRNIYSSVDTQKIILASRVLSATEIEKLHQAGFNSFSFSKTDSHNLFTAGQLYSRSVTYYLQKEYVKSSQSLKALQAFKSDITLDELISQLENQNSIKVTKLYSKYSLALKDSLSEKDYALFTIGAWLTDIKLLTMTNQLENLSRFKTSKDILSENQLSSLHEGVSNGLRELDEYILSSNIKVTDKRKFERILSNIENSLN